MTKHLAENTLQAGARGLSLCFTRPVADDKAAATAAWPRRHMLLACALLAALLFGSLALAVHGHVPGMDAHAVLNFFHASQTPAFVALAENLCAGITVLSVCAPIWMLYRRLWHEAGFWFTAVGGSALLASLLKKVVARHRPELLDVLVPHHSWSFPSGHATQSMAIVLAALLLCVSAHQRRRVALLGLPFVLAVGYARLYLGVHYPSDVLAGWALAAAWVCLIGACMAPNPSVERSRQDYPYYEGQRGSSES